MTNEELNIVTAFVVNMAGRGEALPVRKNITPCDRDKIRMGKEGETLIEDDEIRCLGWKGLKAPYDTRKRKLNNLGKLIGEKNLGHVGKTVMRKQQQEVVIQPSKKLVIKIGPKKAAKAAKADDPDALKLKIKQLKKLVRKQ